MTRAGSVSEATLQRLMAEYQGGSGEAFDGLHEALAPQLRGYLISATRDRARADDLLQETFLQIHRARAAYRPGWPVRPWVFAIAKRVYLMDRRAAGRRARHEVPAGAEAPDASVPASVDQLNERRELALALRRVSPDGRRAFILHHVIGFSFADIAAKLGIDHGAAKVRSSRAASTMRAWLRARGEGRG